MKMLIEKSGNILFLIIVMITMIIPIILIINIGNYLCNQNKYSKYVVLE